MYHELNLGLDLRVSRFDCCGFWDLLLLKGVVRLESEEGRPALSFIPAVERPNPYVIP